MNFRMIPALCLTLALGATGATAQQDEHPQPAVPVEVTEEMVDQFIDIYPRIAGVVAAVEAELAGTEDPETALAIQQQGQQRAAAILEEADMSVEEYSATIAHISSDEALMAAVEERLAEKAGNPER